MGSASPKNTKMPKQNYCGNVKTNMSGWQLLTKSKALEVGAQNAELKIKDNYMSFFNQKGDHDKHYSLTRDNPNRADFREYIENTWNAYKKFCGDSDFQIQASRDFKSAVWHLHVAKVLIDLDLSLIKTASVGPDIGIISNGRKVWFECIATTNGDGVDAVPKSPEGRIYSPDDDGIILRHTHAIHEKWKKYLAWIHSGIVAPEDPYIICLDTGEVDESAFVSHPVITYLERSVFGFGEEQTHIRSNIEAGELEVTGHSFSLQGNIKKQNGEQIQTDGFLSGRLSGISAILYSNINILSSFQMRGSNFNFVHNPTSKNPVEMGLIKVGIEKWKENNELLPKYWSRRS